MCDYVNKSELGKPKQNFNEWINRVKSYMSKNFKGYEFDIMLTGSASRNMAIRRCDNDYFDLDYQVILERIPNGYDWNKSCKQIKNDFKVAFDNTKPHGFKDMKDRSQALRTKNLSLGYGYDVIITAFDSKNNFYILFNKKDTNSNNNNDYEWAIRKDMNKYHQRLALIKGAEMHNYLRNIYKSERHKHMNDPEPKKHSYQIFNECVVRTLEHFEIEYPR